MKKIALLILFIGILTNAQEQSSKLQSRKIQQMKMLRYNDADGEPIIDLIDLSTKKEHQITIIEKLEIGNQTALNEIYESCTDDNGNSKTDCKLLGQIYSCTFDYKLVDIFNFTEEEEFVKTGKKRKEWVITKLTRVVSPESNNNAKTNNTSTAQKSAIDKVKTDKENALKQEKFENSDLVDLRKIVAFNFSKWLTKGEFEKLENYNLRISNDAQNVFDSICYGFIQGKVGLIRANRRVIDRDDDDDYIIDSKPNSANNNWNKNLYFNVEKYDSEKEIFYINTQLNDRKFQDIINVPIEIAEKFEENYKIINPTLLDHEWCFIENNIYPTSYTVFYENVKKELFIPTEIQSKIFFSSNELNIAGLNTNYLFDFSNYRKKLLKKNDLLQQKRLKQIELDSIEYSNKVFSYSDIKGEKPKIIIGAEAFKFKICQLIKDFAAKNKIYLSINNEFKIKFIVEKDGTLSNFISLSNPQIKLIDDELIKLIKEYGNCSPGKNDDLVCRTSCIIFYQPEFNIVYLDD